MYSCRINKIKKATKLTYSYSPSILEFLRRILNEEKGWKFQLLNGLKELFSPSFCVLPLKFIYIVIQLIELECLKMSQIASFSHSCSHIFTIKLFNPLSWKFYWKLLLMIFYRFPLVFSVRPFWLFTFHLNTNCIWCPVELLFSGLL